jgi:hypothetical protein
MVGFALSIAKASLRGPKTHSPASQKARYPTEGVQAFEGPSLAPQAGSESSSKAKFADALPEP